jgi:hypothetical protein
MRVLIVGLALVGFITDAMAQRPVDTHSLQSVMPRLRTGTQVRLDSRSTGRLVGRLGPVDAEGFTLGTGATSRRVLLPDVEALWVRGRATVPGAIVGAIVVGVAGGLFTWVAGSLGCSDDGITDNCKPGLYLVSGGLVGAAIGGGAGAVVGAAIPKWHRRYP